MIPSELRKKAREALKGKWGKAVCIVLAYALITLLISFAMKTYEKNTFVYALLYVVEIVISVPLSFGLAISFLKLKRGEEVSSFSFITDGFTKFNRAWGIWFHIFVRLLLPFVCLIFVAILIGLLVFLKTPYLAIAIIGSIIYIATIVYAVSRALLYTLSYYISYDNTNLSSKDCVKKSAELMTGNRGNLLLLSLSFIGWILLSCITLGIGFLWLIPYIEVSIVCLYDEISTSKAKKIDGEAEIKEGSEEKE